MLFFLKPFKVILLAFFFLGTLTSAYSKQPLAVEDVFHATAKRVDSQTIAVQLVIKPGYYLYREKIHFQCDQKIKSIMLPVGTVKKNKLLRGHQIYEKRTTVLLKFLYPLPHILKFTINYQGCAAAGFCYPPVTHQFVLATQKGVVANKKDLAFKEESAPESEQGKTIKLLASHNIALILLSFFGFGLLLSLTPCVLPLIPILSAIILGQKQRLTTLKAFSLALTYVLAMALTYALAGVFAGLAGSYLQSFLQSRWVIIFVSLVFILLAFSLFGFYELSLPAKWQEKLTNLTNRQQGGNYWGVALMGCLSTLVVSPCVTAPLVGVLTYIGNTGNAVLGGFALFVLGLGSGVPLLIIGTSAGKWLPKSGPWMNGVKIVLGFMMLAMAGWLLLRIIPQKMHFFHKTNINQVISTNSFRSVKSIDDLNKVLVEARKGNKLVFLDFYANWCLSCKEMEHVVFSDPRVKSLLSHFIVLRADVTANDVVDKALEKRFSVVAPPTFLFLTPDGKELSKERIVGQVDREAFIKHLQRAISSR